MVIGQGQEPPAEVSDDDRGDDGQPDLLQCLQPPRPIPDTVLGGAARENGDDGVAIPSLRPLSTLNVRRIRTERPVGDDRQAECRVGGREDGGEQRGRRPLDTGENEMSHQRARRNREWQPHEKQPGGQAGVALDVTQPDRGGTGEQQQGQRQLGDGEDGLAASARRARHSARQRPGSCPRRRTPSGP